MPLVTSMWSRPPLSARICSRVWEYGPCPTSCNIAATCRVSLSKSSIERDSAILPAMWEAPNECSNRVWWAPGNTKWARPNCLMWLSLFISGVERRSFVTPSNLNWPWIASLMTFTVSQRMPCSHVTWIARCLIGTGYFIKGNLYFNCNSIAIQLYAVRSSLSFRRGK